jgi:hypothetical protein
MRGTREIKCKIKYLTNLCFSGTHQLLVYTDDMNLLDDIIDPIKKNTETIINASKEVGVEVNAEKTMYTLLSRHQNAGQNHNINRCKRYFENVAQFRYLGTTTTNQNLIREEIKRRLISDRDTR